MNINNELKMRLEKIRDELTKAYNAGKLTEYLLNLDMYEYSFHVKLTPSCKLVYDSVSFLVTYQKPNIYIDTGAGCELIGEWDGIREEVSLDLGIVDELNNYGKDMYDRIE